jgi:hypothetical protein
MKAEQHVAGGVSGPGGLRRLADQRDRHPKQELRRQIHHLPPGKVTHPSGWHLRPGSSFSRSSFL